MTHHLWRMVALCRTVVSTHNFVVFIQVHAHLRFDCSRRRRYLKEVTRKDYAPPSGLSSKIPLKRVFAGVKDGIKVKLKMPTVSGPAKFPEPTFEGHDFRNSPSASRSKEGTRRPARGCSRVNICSEASCMPPEEDVLVESQPCRPGLEPHYNTRCRIRRFHFVAPKRADFPRPSVNLHLPRSLLSTT